MPWNPQDTMQLRLEFVTLALQQEIAFSELCQRFGISRQTGYKWVNRVRVRFFFDGFPRIPNGSA